MQWQQLRPWLRRTRHSRRRRRQWLRGPPRPPLDHPPNEASMTMTPSKAPQRDLRGAARGMTSDHQWVLRGVTLEGDAEQVQLQVFTQAALLMITVQRAPLFQSMRFSPSSRQKAGPLLLVGRARPHHGHLAGRRAVSRSDHGHGTDAAMVRGDASAGVRGGVWMQWMPSTHASCNAMIFEYA